MESTIDVNPTATTRIHNVHSPSLIIGNVSSPVQTRSQLKEKKQSASAFMEPASVDQALNNPDWVEAMQEEMQQFKNQQVWVLVELPKGKRAIGTKWILKNKRDARGIVCQNKARLVAQGHRQEEGIDYTEVFAPVARVEAIRLFLAFASFMGFMVYQNGYRRGTIDQTLFLKKNAKDIILVQVYVDDIIFGSTRQDWSDEFESLMQSEFEMSSMGQLTFFLGTTAFSDSDYAGATGDRKSTTGGCQYLGRRLISWQCKKQTIVATSSCEAEYVAAASCCGQVAFLEKTKRKSDGFHDIIDFIKSTIQMLLDHGLEIDSYSLRTNATSAVRLIRSLLEQLNPSIHLRIHNLTGYQRTGYSRVNGYCSGGSKLVAVKTLLGLSLVADLIHCYMFTLLLIHSFKTQQGQAGWLLAVVVAVKSSLLNFCGAFI
ncbi:putative ribonuclease H-like domain-containing protein [Tanacetum coccineum]